MRLCESEIDRAMWYRDLYVTRQGNLKAEIRLTMRGMFTGKIMRNGQCVASATALSLPELLSQLRSETEASNGANNIRPKTFSRSDARVEGHVTETRGSSRASTGVNAGAEPKAVGNPQAKVAFDWGQNIEREVNDGHQSGVGLGQSGQEGFVPESGDAAREGFGADVLQGV